MSGGDSSVVTTSIDPGSTPFIAAARNSDPLPGDLAAGSGTMSFSDLDEGTSSYAISPDDVDEGVHEPLLSGRDAGSWPVKELPEGAGCFARFTHNYPCLLFIVGNEFCERFSYYGMRTILLVYLTDSSQGLGMGDDDATTLYHAFVVACYFFPVLGGHIADTYWGKFKTIVVLSIVYCTGSVAASATAVPEVRNVTGLYGVSGALLLVAIGTGGIKPCVSAFGGDQYGPHQAVQQATFFSIFYFSINVGSMLSTIVTPIIKDQFSFAAAFLVPACLLVVATAIFISGSARYVKVPPTGKSTLGLVIDVLGASMRNRNNADRKVAHTHASSKGEPPHWTDAARGTEGLQDGDIDDVRQLLAVLWLMLPLPAFWTLYDQTGSRWTLQAARADLRLVNPFNPAQFISVLPEQIQVVNAALILLFIPLFDQCIYPCFAACGLRTRPIGRMVAGMVLCGVSFVMAGMLEIWMKQSPENSVNVLYQLPQYVVLTAAEILFSIQGLAFSYAQAPQSMKSVVSSAWLITVAVGNVITIAVASVKFFDDQEMEFFFFAGMVVFFALVFACFTCGYVYVEDRRSA